MTEAQSLDNGVQVREIINYEVLLYRTYNLQDFILY